MKQISEEHLDSAIRAAKSGGADGYAYDQESWCGAARCVLGLARLYAGIPEVNTGPRPNEIVDTPRAKTIAGLMMTLDPQVLHLMEAVQADGSIVLSAPFMFSGDLDISGTAITALPEGLSVGGYLDLSRTAITSLPEGLSVGGSLYMDNQK